MYMYIHWCSVLEPTVHNVVQTERMDRWGICTLAYNRINYTFIMYKTMWPTHTTVHSLNTTPHPHTHHTSDSGFILKVLDQLCTRDLMVQIQRISWFSKSLEGARSDGMLEFQIWMGYNFYQKQAKMSILILTNHLKGLSLSFQKIIK